MKIRSKLILAVSLIVLLVAVSGGLVSYFHSKDGKCSSYPVVRGLAAAGTVHGRSYGEWITTSGWLGKLGCLGLGKDGGSLRSCEFG